GFDAASAETELQPPVGQQIDRRSLTRHENGMTQVIVEHVRANPQTGGRVRGRDQRRKRRDPLVQVIRKVQRVVAERLDLSGLLNQLASRCDVPDADAEPKWL